MSDHSWFREAVHDIGGEYHHRSAFGWRRCRLAVLSAVHVQRGWDEPAGEHHGVGARAVPGALRSRRDTARHLLLRLRAVAPPAVPRTLCREPQTRAAAHPAGPRTRAVRGALPDGAGAAGAASDVRAGEGVSAAISGDAGGAD